MALESSPERRKKKKNPPKPNPSPTPGPTGGATSGEPTFGQPAPSPDPTGFKVHHGSDSGLYSKVDPTLLEPVPQPRDGEVEPVLTLEEVYGDAGAGVVATIEKSGQIVFHAVGDTGSVKGPTTQSLVADKMVADFTENDPADVPSFFFHLGDVVYSFGESQYYYDQFYEPFREYPGPIVALPGNHDGVVYKGDPQGSLDSFLRNFCATAPVHTPEAGGLVRTAMIAPSVYFTFDSPFVRILAIYSNVLEDPGVISSQGDSASPVDGRQLAFLTAALSRAKSENYGGAVIVAVHHPPYTYGTQHSGSPLLLQDLDTAATNAGYWPHAVLSGHAHNYQRFTRSVNGGQIPYIVAGSGGHAVSALQSGGNGTGLRTPVAVNSTLTLENYDDKDYGYLRIIGTAQTLRIEFHPASDGAGMKTPDDVVTVNLATRTIS
jgi:Calcineurin-like phosphoesterase